MLEYLSYTIVFLLSWDILSRKFSLAQSEVSPFFGYLVRLTWVHSIFSIMTRPCLNGFSRLLSMVPLHSYTTPQSHLRYNPLHSAVHQCRSIQSAIRWKSKSKTYFVFCFSFFSAQQSVELLLCF